LLFERRRVPVLRIRHLQDNGVRCWFAPHDLPTGAKTWDKIDEAIRLRDKLLLILSKASIASDWVEDEVTKAHAEERRRKEVVLFPIRIDDAVMSRPNRGPLSFGISATSGISASGGSQPSIATASNGSCAT
jgi:hypothetical protein